jgi:hypothetical protein
VAACSVECCVRYTGSLVPDLEHVLHFCPPPFLSSLDRSGLCVVFCQGKRDSENLKECIWKYFTVKFPVFSYKQVNVYGTGVYIIRHDVDCLIKWSVSISLITLSLSHSLSCMSALLHLIILSCSWSSSKCQPKLRFIFYHCLLHSMTTSLQ